MAEPEHNLDTMELSVIRVVILTSGNMSFRLSNAQKAHRVEIMLGFCHPACLLSLAVVYGRTDGIQPLGMTLMAISLERLRDVRADRWMYQWHVPALWEDINCYTVLTAWYRYTCSPFCGREVV